MAKRKHKKDPYSEREALKYENPIPSREFILEHLAERGRPATQYELQSELDLATDEEQEALRRRLIAMTRDGQLLKNRKGAYGPLASMELIAGTVIGHKDGFGFVVPDRVAGQKVEKSAKDLFLSPRQMRHVFHGDRVLARVSSIDQRGRREAVIVEVLERNTQQIVGRFYTESGVCYVEPSNQRITQEILIPPNATKEATNGQIVVAAVIAQPSPYSRPLGEVVEVLGDHMAPGMEINVAIRNHGLPFIWPDAALAEASAFPPFVSADEIDKRKDYRPLTFVTIDGEDAKDFDDAVYCEAKPQGGWNLYVAIADVSHYVKPGSHLDQEAYERGNSVYFPGRVIPMLPEVLSNNLCSLNPKVDRLVLVCEMTIHATGRIMRYSFHEGVIHSKARLTYNQVHSMIEKGDKRLRDRFDRTILDNLENLYDLFRTLHKARKARGAIDFDLPETKIVYGRDRKIEKIVPYERFNSHRVIEEAMLSANISAARFLQKKRHAGLYRVHEGPTEEKLNDLRRFLNEMGLKMPGTRLPVPADYAHILRVVQDRPDAHLIQTVLLRSMSQAIYSPDNRGHFGLAYEAYTHFTSPIRRYPDLLVHRAIKHLLAKQSAQEISEALIKAGEHCSMTERRADDATQEAIDWLKCEFMMDKVGQSFAGIISGVMNFGIFVELKEIYVEGLIHISVLPDDYYQFDPIKHALIGERTGKRFRLGDPIEVTVGRVDLDKREIDFVIAGLDQSQRKGGRLTAQPKQKNNQKNNKKNNQATRKEKNAKREDRKARGKRKRK